MLGHSATLSHALSQTHPLIDEALLSPPARPPVDILSINLSSCSAFPVNLSTPPHPPSPISHQSMKALNPPSSFAFVFSHPQTLYSNLLVIEPPPPPSLWSLSRAHQLFPGPFRVASPLSPGVHGVFVRAPAHCFTMTLHSIKVRSAC